MMPTHYSHACAAEQRLLNPPPADLLATTYQFEKYLKHRIRSIGCSPSSTARTRRSTAATSSKASGPDRLK